MRRWGLPSLCPSPPCFWVCPASGPSGLVKTSMRMHQLTSLKLFNESHCRIYLDVYKPFIIWLLASSSTSSAPLSSPPLNIEHFRSPARRGASFCSSHALGPVPPQCLCTCCTLGCRALSTAGDFSGVIFSVTLPYHTSSAARQSLHHSRHTPVCHVFHITYNLRLPRRLVYEFLLPGPLKKGT